MVKQRRLSQMAAPRDDTPDPQKLLRLARQTMSSAERRKKYRAIDFLDTTFWYPTQLKFFDAGGGELHQRYIYGGNQTGKTKACSAEASWHFSGLYPSWWRGKRFNRPIRAWVVGESSTLVRDTLQKQLCGIGAGGQGDNSDFGTGTIPLECFARKPVMVAGGTGAIDTMFITHHTDGKVDGVSTGTFKSFEMRREKLQSESVDLIWIDERCSEEIYSELLARTAATGGIILISYTAIGENAAGGVTYKFLSEPSSDRAAFRITSEEVKHITPARREELAGGFTDAERETRLEGIPQMGTGPIFPLDLLPTIVKTFNPDDILSWTKLIVGIDFGYDHPFAAVLLAWSPSTNQTWVLDSFRMERSSALYHVQRIHSMTQGLRVPIAWPHDGSVHDKGSGLPLAGQYKAYNANMLPRHAINHGTHHFNVEPALEELRAAWYGGTITIAPHNAELIEELRHYHRDADFKIVKERDDLVSALRYAYMMRRKGKLRSECDGIGGSGLPYAASVAVAVCRSGRAALILTHSIRASMLREPQQVAESGSAKYSRAQTIEELTPRGADDARGEGVGIQRRGRKETLPGPYR
jgi:phage terminase large subunit-like protein